MKLRKKNQCKNIAIKRIRTKFDIKKVNEIKYLVKKSNESKVQG
jgi:hypothetical protein